MTKKEKGKKKHFHNFILFIVTVSQNKTRSKSSSFVDIQDL